MAFDPQAFLDQSVDQANDTKTVPVPVGEYTAVISKVDPRPWQSKQDPTKSGVTLDVTWEIDDANVKTFLGRDKVTCRQGIMLDLDDMGKLDMGKGRNVGLGRLRSAVGLNTPGVPFAFGHLVGRPAKVSVTHDVQGEDIYARVTAVAAL